jgi:hypothetical protein
MADHHALRLTSLQLNRSGRLLTPRRVNDALRLKADHDRRLRALDEFLVGYEAEHGEISEEEMREAARSARSRAVVVRGAPESRRQGRGRGQGAA